MRDIIIRDFSSSRSLQKPLKKIKGENTICPGVTTIRGWWNWYTTYQELPYETDRFYSSLRTKKHHTFDEEVKFTKKWSRFFIRHLKDVVNKHPVYFLDEIAEEMFIRTGALFHLSSVYKVLRKRLGCSLKVFSEVVWQRNYARREVFRATLHCILRYIDQLVLVDETAKDRNAGRRARAWGRIGPKFQLEKWFREEARYTMMGAADINGFILQACKIKIRYGSEVPRTKTGASGMVDQKEFADWVEFYLCLSVYFSFRLDVLSHVAILPRYWVVLTIRRTIVLAVLGRSLRPDVGGLLLPGVEDCHLGKMMYCQRALLSSPC